MVQNAKAVKNRLHIDIHASGDRQTRSRRGRSEWTPKPTAWWALDATITCVMYQEYAVGMKDPEGNEFDINSQSRFWAG